MSLEQNVNEAHYSVVILNPNSVTSRGAGKYRLAAIELAEQRRKDFPDAEEIRVVHPTHGIVFTC